MTEMAEHFKPQLIILPPQDRAELAEFLFDSLDSQSDEQSDAAFKEELQQRAEEIRTGAVGGRRAQEFLDELETRLS